MALAVGMRLSGKLERWGLKREGEGRWEIRGEEEIFTSAHSHSYTQPLGQKGAATARACPPFGAGQEQHVSGSSPSERILFQ